MAVDMRAIADALGGRRALRADMRDPRALARGVSSGLPFASLEALMARFGIARADLAKVLRIPPRTLARRRAEGRLRPDESDRLVRLARVAAESSRVLGDDERAAEWLRSRIFALGGVTPISLLDTEPGVVQVEEILAHIEYGMVS